MSVYLADDLFEVGIEVDAHGVGEDVDAGFDAVSVQTGRLAP